MTDLVWFFNALVSLLVGCTDTRPHRLADVHLTVLQTEKL